MNIKMLAAALCGVATGCSAIVNDPQVNVPLRPITAQEKQNCEQQAVLAEQNASVRSRAMEFSDKSQPRVRLPNTQEAKWAYDAAMRECLQNLQRQ